MTSTTTLVQEPDVQVEYVEPQGRQVAPLVVTGQLGEGGPCLVHEVQDPNLRHTRAMKCLRPSSAQNPTARRRLVVEAQVTAQLDHPHVVPVHELGVDAQGRLYFTMKLVRGRSLAQRLAERAPEDWGLPALHEDLEILLKVCDAVAFAHAKGAIHRDIKSENVMVGTYGQVYLLDWGIAVLRRGAPLWHAGQDPSSSRGAPTTAEPGAIMGTLASMAPEQATGDTDAIDERTDVFQLGGLLYEVLTGLPPYGDGTVPELLVRAVQGAVTPPEQVTTRRLPGALCRAAMKALARDPRDRYPSVVALQADLRHYLRSGLHFPERFFPAGALVVQEGQPGNEAFIIQRGRCRAFKGTGGGRQALREMGPGDVFGETAVFTDKPRTASVEAVDDVTVLVVGRDDLQEGLGASQVLAPFVRALAQRFREADARCTDLERQLSAALGHAR
jgi:serine/threonine-protein kinase